jgi:hypothetical protein
MAQISCRLVALIDGRAVGRQKPRMTSLETQVGSRRIQLVLET